LAGAPAPEVLIEEIEEIVRRSVGLVSRETASRILYRTKLLKALLSGEGSWRSF